jgi:branched-chain amino acid transport system permease protein
MLGFNSKQLMGVGIFLFMIFIGVPLAIGVTGRWDFYFTLTSVALLAIASAGVWLTFYIGRIKIGLPILRLRGVYFAMITLVLTQVVTLTALALPITNGARGISNIPLPSGISVFGIPILPDFAAMENTKLAFYYTACIIMLLTYAALYRLVNSRLGHLCRSMQQNEELASSIGVNISYIRIVIFAISSFFGGLGGAMFGSIAQSVYPSSFQVADSVNFMLNCFLGGLGYVFGPMLGTLVLYFGWDLLFEFGKYQMLIYSTILIVIIRFLPNGLLSIRFGKGGDR